MYLTDYFKNEKITSFEVKIYVSSLISNKLGYHWAILKKMFVGGNPSCCNLERSPARKVFQVFLRFTKIYLNDTH